MEAPSQGETSRLWNVLNGARIFRSERGVLNDGERAMTSRGGARIFQTSRRRILGKIVIPMTEMESEHRAGPLDMVTVSGLHVVGKLLFPEGTRVHL